MPAEEEFGTAAANNLVEVQNRQLAHGGIANFLERCFSVDGVKRYKPSPQTYGYVQRELGVGSSRFCLIASLGAVAAGWEAALAKRVGNDVLGVGPQPQIVGDDLKTLPVRLSPVTRGGADPPAKF
jgi:2-haloacid dehalogenase